MHQAGSREAQSRGDSRVTEVLGVADTCQRDTAWLQERLLEQEHLSQARAGVCLAWVRPRGRGNGVWSELRSGA